MKCLIINADDFGNYQSVNRGIIEGVSKGIITSTSLMVTRKYANEINLLSNNSNISIGLHFELPKDGNNVIEEFDKQISFFKKLVGRKPDHIDSHKVRPKNIEGLKSYLEKYSKETKTPIRDWGHANLIDSFFGLNLEGTGTLDITKLSPEALINTLNKNLQEGYNELMCHAGYVDEEVMNATSYNKPREMELNTLLSNEFKAYLKIHTGIQLISWNEVKIY